MEFEQNMDAHNFLYNLHSIPILFYSYTNKNPENVRNTDPADFCITYMTEFILGRV